MAKLKILNRLMVGKGAVTSYIGEGTDVTHIDKDDAKKHGIAAKEFDRLVERGVLVTDDGAQPVQKSAEPKQLSAATFKAFSDAVVQLEPGNEKHWTTDEKPEVAALKEFGCEVTAVERDELFALYLED